MEYIKVSKIKELDNPSKYYIFDFIDEFRCFEIDDNFYNFYIKNKSILTDIYAPIYLNRGICIIRNYFNLKKESFILFFSKEYKIDKFEKPFEVRANNIFEEIKKCIKKEVFITKSTLEDGTTCFILDTNAPCYKENILNVNKQIYNELKKYKKIDDELYNELFPIEKKINLCIAKDCFVRCIGCYNMFCKESNLKFDKLCSFLEYGKNKGLEKITLSGGDPLTMPNIIPIIKKCINLNIDINLDTVGLSFIDDIKIYGENKVIKRFNEKDLEYLRKIKLIGIPLDGSNDNIIKKFRTYDGNLFEKQIEVLDFLEKERINFCINTVLHKGNVDDLLNIYNIIKKYKYIKKWQIFEFMPIGIYGYNNRNIFELDENEFETIKNSLEFDNNRNIEIEFKKKEERSYNYMLVNSNGDAYKVDLNNNVESFGNIMKKSDWGEIIKNLF